MNPLRIVGRRKVRACGYCARQKPWPDAFVNSHYAQCLTCWLGENREKVPHFIAALRDIGALPSGDTTPREQT